MGIQGANLNLRYSTRHACREFLYRFMTHGASIQGMQGKRRGRFDNRGPGRTGRPAPMVRGRGGAYAPGEREARRTEKTGWDEMAPWYAGWAGGGSDFHKKYALPEVMRMLDLKRGERVVDLGCGFGVLREPVEKAGGEYTGVDKSPTMIRTAQKALHGEQRRTKFFVSDVARVGGIALPGQEKFDKAVFMFSIQDIDNHREAIKNAAQLLNKGGSLVLFMIHPAFRIPRQSGWGTDAGRKLTYRRMDRYKGEVTIPLPQRTGDTQTTSFFYHRPLQSYADALKDAGFVITDLKEIYSGTKGAETEFPHFLLIRAVAKS